MCEVFCSVGAKREERDVENGSKFYNEYSHVPEEMAKLREVVMARKEPRKLLVQPHMYKDKDSSHPFWQLEYPRQLERLVSLGAIRDLADECFVYLEWNAHVNRTTHSAHRLLHIQIEVRQKPRPIVETHTCLA